MALVTPDPSIHAWNRSLKGRRRETHPLPHLTPHISKEKGGEWSRGSGGDGTGGDRDRDRWRDILKTGFFFLLSVCLSVSHLSSLISGSPSLLHLSSHISSLSLFLEERRGGEGLGGGAYPW